MGPNGQCNPWGRGGQPVMGEAWVPRQQPGSGSPCKPLLQETPGCVASQCREVRGVLSMVPPDPRTRRATLLRGFQDLFAPSTEPSPGI